MRPGVSSAASAAALCAIVLCLAPAMARGEGTPRFHVDTGNGYRIAVEGDGSTVVLSTMRRGRSSRSIRSVSGYIARGRAGAGAIRAKFGNLGSVDVHFRPSGKVTRGARVSHCGGPNRRIVRSGVFVGDLRFRGEGGYTSVHVRRAKGRVLTRLSLSCQIAVILRRPSGHAVEAEPKETKTTSLVADFRSGVTARYFAAATSGGKTRFIAASERTEGSLGLYRVVFVKASPLRFAFDSALSFGSVTPPPPFSGSASLQRAAGGAKSWAGTLAVSFLGEPDVALTGAKFKTRLTRSW